MVFAVPSQSKATIPSLRKRRVAAPDASATSSGTVPMCVLIENVDIEALIKSYVRTSKHDPIYQHIQEYITKVSL